MLKDGGPRILAHLALSLYSANYCTKRAFLMKLKVCLAGLREESAELGQPFLDIPLARPRPQKSGSLHRFATEDP